MSRKWVLHLYKMGSIIMNLNKTTSLAALLCTGLTLGGCPSAKELLADKIADKVQPVAAAPVLPKPGIILAEGEATNAIGRSADWKATCLKGSTGDSGCVIRSTGDVSQYSDMKATVEYFKKADGTPITDGKFAVGDTAVFKASYGDLAGFTAVYTDVSEDDNGNGTIDPYEKDYEFVTTNTVLNKSIEIDKSRFGDDFYQFVEVEDTEGLSKTSSDVTNEYNGRYKFVTLIQGTLTPTDKINKSAKFKGTGKLDVTKVGASNIYENADYSGDSEISITQDGKVNGSVANLSTNAGDENDITIDGAVGSTVGLHNATLSGAAFSGGSVTWKNAAGTDILPIAPEASDFVGGFYGPDMNVAAGLFGAQTTKDKDTYLLDGQFEAIKQ
jgi:hypothetical protein